MDRWSVIEALRSVSLFRSLRGGDLQRVAQLASLRGYKQDALIVQQGDTAVALYCILSGRVRIQRQTGGPETAVTLAELGPGGFFGEMTLLDDFPRSATVIATAATECALISKWDFQQQLKAHPEIGLALLRVLSERVRTLDDRLSL
jgi:CRP/FNR family transcriptional regulator, cyclic AMP receptor protein